MGVGFGSDRTSTAGQHCNVWNNLFHTRAGAVPVATVPGHHARVLSNEPDKRDGPSTGSEGRSQSAHLNPRPLSPLQGILQGFADGRKVDEQWAPLLDKVADFISPRPAASSLTAEERAWQQWEQ
eukprot:EG_transcript_22512